VVAVKQEDIAAVKASELFDEKWYLEQHPDVEMLGMDPVEHFLWLGWRINRSPSPKFCVPSYLGANSDVARAKINPFLHYLRHGVKENRPIYPVIPHADKEARVPVRRTLVRRHREWDESLSMKATTRLNALQHDTEGTLVSVIMPTKNRAPTISAAISSVLNQSHRNLELIIVDDGGTDDTDAVVRKLNDGRIRYLKFAQSEGVSRARNIGLAEAKGQWVFFLDSDNTWHPDMVRFGLTHAFHRQLSAGYCAADLLDDEGHRKAVLYADFDYESCLRENFIDLNCFFLRWEGEFRKLRFDEKLKRLVDWDFILKVGCHTRIAGSPYIGVNYYDGSSARISNQEHRTNILELVATVRAQAREYALSAQTILDKSAYRIAVVFHVFHPEAVEGCISYLRNIEFDYDLFITTSLSADEGCIQSLLDAFPDAALFRFPNHGADIAPFLEIVSTLTNYALVCKIHTKRDAGNWGASWRKELLESVLGSSAHVQRIVDIFKANRELMMVCSKSLYKDGRRNSIPETLRRTVELSRDVGIEENKLQSWGFAAGTMFWIRPQALSRLAGHMVGSAGYSKVFRQDGAIEHALERVIGMVISAKDGAMVGLADRGRIEVTLARTGMEEEGVSSTLRRLVAAQ